MLRRILLSLCTLAFLAVARGPGHAIIPVSAGAAVQDLAAYQADPTRQPGADGPQLTLLPGTVSTEADVEQAVLDTLSSAVADLPAMSYAVITALREDDDWCFVSVAGLRETRPDGSWYVLENASWVGVVALKRTPDGGWAGAAQDTPAFASLLGAAAGTSLTARARQDLAPLSSPAFPSDAAYRFPWQPGTKMLYGARGVHPADFATYFGIPGWVAADMVSDGDTGQGHAPNRLLAAGAGTVGYVCNDGTSVAIRMDYNGSKQFLYAHLAPGNPKLQTGYSFAQGEEIGPLRTGPFSPPNGCGWANQGSGWFHVHWGFPSAPGALQVDGWTLALAGTANGQDNYVPWTRPGQAIYPDGYQWLPAGGAPPAPLLLNPPAGDRQPSGYNLKFTWAAAPGAAEYQIEWAGGPYTSTLPAGWFAGTSYDVDQVTTGTYTWRVRGRNEAGAGPWSETRQITIGDLQIVSPLAFQPPMPHQGRTAATSFGLFNATGQTITLPALAVQVRGPGCNEWECPRVADFPAITDVTISPGENYTYTAGRLFDVAGTGYLAAPAYLDGTGAWQRSIPGASPIVVEVGLPLNERAFLPLLLFADPAPAARSER